MKLKKHGSLIVVSGPSGVGKDTVCKEFLKNNSDIYLSISMTSRDPRGKEEEGKDYFFVSKEEFKKNIKNKSFLEYAKVHDNYYGTPIKTVIDKLNKGIDVLLIIDIQGALKVKKKFKNGIFLFIMPPNMRELKNRLIARGTETKEKVISRFRTAYKEINAISKYNYVVVNDEVKEAAKKIEAIIVAEKCSVNRIEDLELKNKEELIHELMID